MSKTEKELIAQIANDVEWIKLSLSKKADAWVELWAKAIITIITGYFLTTWLELYKIPLIASAL